MNAAPSKSFFKKHLFDILFKVVGPSVCPICKQEGAIDEERFSPSPGLIMCVLSYL